MLLLRFWGICQGTEGQKERKWQRVKSNNPILKGRESISIQGLRLLLCRGQTQAAALIQPATTHHLNFSTRPSTDPDRSQCKGWAWIQDLGCSLNRLSCCFSCAGRCRIGLEDLSPIHASSSHNHMHDWSRTRSRAAAGSSLVHLYWVTWTSCGFSQTWSHPWMGWLWAEPSQHTLRLRVMYVFLKLWPMFVWVVLAPPTDKPTPGTKNSQVCFITECIHICLCNYPHNKYALSLYTLIFYILSVEYAIHDMCMYICIYMYITYIAHIHIHIICST